MEVIQPHKSQQQCSLERVQSSNSNKSLFSLLYKKNDTFNQGFFHLLSDAVREHGHGNAPSISAKKLTGLQNKKRSIKNFVL